MKYAWWIAAAITAALAIGSLAFHTLPGTFCLVGATAFGVVAQVASTKGSKNEAIYALAFIVLAIAGLCFIWPARMGGVLLELIKGLGRVSN